MMVTQDTTIPRLRQVLRESYEKSYEKPTCTSDSGEVPNPRASLESRSVKRARQIVGELSLKSRLS
jgi:hypothetical protein